MDHVWENYINELEDLWIKSAYILDIVISLC